MSPKSTIDAIINLDGVYGAFYCSHDQEEIVAKMPSDYPTEHIQSLAHDGNRLLERFRETMKDCDEVVSELGPYAVANFLVSAGLIHVLIFKRRVLDLVRDLVRGSAIMSESEVRKRMLLTARIPTADLMRQIQPPEIPEAQMATTDSKTSSKEGKSEVVASATSSGPTLVKTPPSSTQSPARFDEPTPSPPAIPAEAYREDSSRYSSERIIGEGGTAVVYQAYDTRLKRQVAIKRFKPCEHHSDQNDYISEMQCASHVQHPNVIGTYDADVDRFGRYMVMELIRGEDLEKRVQRAPIPVNEFIELASQCLEGLCATHESGLLHLDIKLSNIMVGITQGTRPVVKLIDFGRARLLSEKPRGAGLSASIHYASPEFLSELPVDERADLYSLGCVFYTMLAGVRPFDGDSSVMVMSAHIQNDVQPLIEVAPVVPQWLSDWVMTFIQAEADERHQSAGAALGTLATRELFQQRRA